jgi:Protein of unknown function (DUF3455)
LAVFRIAATIICLIVSYGVSAAEVPAAIAATGETAVFQAHAEGAQIYECKTGQSSEQLGWRFREPVAALFEGGNTVGVHYAGPKWQIGNDIIAAKVTASAPSPSGKDIPWLKLQVTTDANAGPLRGIIAIQRLNTVGGVLEGACEKAGELRPVPYGADYVFLKKQQRQ